MHGYMPMDEFYIPSIFPFQFKKNYFSERWTNLNQQLKIPEMAAHQTQAHEIY